ncbi:hypothetical protein RRG08_064001 [Elysia crispata]|uniref:Uncharacterized protein n=1 Tax=Elysia crispata TaxID=231223 RepID=A0AAE0YF22_9GAST|nr:hypothetical protein RRG08_064001 [Elysia crispata]
MNLLEHLWSNSSFIAVKLSGRNRIEPDGAGIKSQLMIGQDVLTTVHCHVLVSTPKAFLSTYRTNNL